MFVSGPKKCCDCYQMEVSDNKGKYTRERRTLMPNKVSLLEPADAVIPKSLNGGEGVGLQCEV